MTLLLLVLAGTWGDAAAASLCVYLSFSARGDDVTGFLNQP